MGQREKLSLNNRRIKCGLYRKIQILIKTPMSFCLDSFEWVETYRFLSTLGSRFCAKTCFKFKFLKMNKIYFSVLYSLLAMIFDKTFDSDYQFLQAIKNELGRPNPSFPNS